MIGFQRFNSVRVSEHTKCSSVYVRSIIEVLVVCFLAAIQAKSTKKKHTTEEASTLVDSKTKRKAMKNSPSAIVAIEIVDPKMKTSSKTSKRTIESSLGYGYQSFVGATHQQPKFEFYKYSQHDIPPYRGSDHNVFSGQSYDTQKYQSSNHHQAEAPSYQPGTTLYSTVSQSGQLGDFSSQAPHSQKLHGASPVPVIILRVYPSQLADASNGLYPKLPQTHPLASNLNSIDLQSLLANYFQGVMQQQHQPHQQNHHHTDYQQQEYQHAYQQQYQYQQPTHQYLSQSLPQLYNVPQYQAPQYLPSMQYEQPSIKSETDQSSSNGLLTHENYPSNSHTKVIFRDHKGNIKTSQTEEEPHVPIHTKTIKIHVPPGISGVEVQTPDTQYAYTNKISEDNNQYQGTNEGSSYYYYNTQLDQPNQGYYQQQQQGRDDTAYQEEVSEQQPMKYTPEISEYDQPPQQYAEQSYQATADNQDINGNGHESEQPETRNHHPLQKRKLRSKKRGITEVPSLTVSK